jgi:SAM-dependent methyltransferase
VIAGLEWELKHLGPAANLRARRALEIGCGPGRLLKLMSRHFGEIHGVDVADEMIAIARERLKGVAHAHVHATDGSTLAQFADDSFHFVYSYAVFQHIPSRDVVLEYCREARRVMKTDAIFRAQFNGLPRTFPAYDTWSGVRFSADELIAFTRESGFQVLSLDGADTQYMWTTWRKREAGWRDRARASRHSTARIRRITNAQNTEPVAPARGRYASISIWVERLPYDADLFDIDVLIAGHRARATYIGPPDSGGVQQVNAILPDLECTGLLPVELKWFGEPLAPVTFLRVIPPGPQVPRVSSISDGINLTSGTRIETGTFKVTLEEVGDPDSFAAALDGVPVREIEIFCTDPQPRRYEVNFKLPPGTNPGAHTLQMSLGRRQFAPVLVQVC